MWNIVNELHSSLFFFVSLMIIIVGTVFILGSGNVRKRKSKYKAGFFKKMEIKIDLIFTIFFILLIITFSFIVKTYIQEKAFSWNRVEFYFIYDLISSILIYLGMELKIFIKSSILKYKTKKKHK